MFMSVDLPDPDEPMMATDSPASMRSEIPCRTGTSTSPRLYFLVTASSSSRTSPMRAPSEHPPQAAGRLTAARRRGRRGLLGVRADALGHELVARLELALGDLGRGAVRDADTDAYGARVDARKHPNRA